jgi:hypothetical protein
LAVAQASLAIHWMPVIFLCRMALMMLCTSDSLQKLIMTFEDDPC